jgi:hypothetical protein
MYKALHGTQYIFDYLFAIARVVCYEDLATITFDDIHRIIKKLAISLQTTKEIEAGKKWRDYRKKALEPTFMKEATDKTIAAMILWGYLERPSPTEKSSRKERWYYVRPSLLKIGEAILKEKLHKAKLMLFNSILQSERESAFTPQLLTRIRDSSTKSELEKEYKLPTDGVIQWSTHFVRNHLKISQLDFKNIISWYQELGFLNVFDPKILDINLPKEIYLTIWLATDGELSSYYDKIVEGKAQIKSFADIHCMSLLENIKAIRLENDHPKPLMGKFLEIDKNQLIQESLRNPFESKLILIGEKSRFRGIVTTEVKQMEKIYLLFPKQVTLDDFSETLKKHYDILRVKWKSPYVWISPLRALCCRTLMITDSSFDDMLIQLYEREPEALEFSKAATGIFRKRVRVFEKPFKLYGNPFRMIRLVKNIE